MSTFDFETAYDPFQDREDRSGMRVRPGFLITGAQLAPDKFVVLGSSRLTESEMTEEVEYEILRWRDSEAERVRREYTLTTKMSDVVRAYGSSYAEALAHLFRQWTPPGSTGLLLGVDKAPTQAIEPDSEKPVDKDDAQGLL